MPLTGKGSDAREFRRGVDLAAPTVGLRPRARSLRQSRAGSSLADRSSGVMRRALVGVGTVLGSAHATYPHDLG
jgi:hypothetical protein